ncbi:HAMP domain-containing sensor histidine kinase [Corynebacterium sp. Q4381]|uniref:HAMP domain-containing sensor histidine kinase n=1 Tax=Corynebacterium sp. Marseille-Q4381 TaxID=3121597 RepID=UPI002FE547BA
MRQHLGLLTTAMVAVTILVSGMAGYWAFRSALTNVLDSELVVEAQTLLAEVQDVYIEPDEDDELVMRERLALFKSHNPFTRVAVSPSGTNAFFGDPVPVGGQFRDQIDGGKLSTRTLGGERIIVYVGPAENAVALSQTIDPYGRISGSLGAALLIIVGIGALLAWAVGGAVVAAGLRPLRRLQRATDDVTRTGELNLLPVDGDDIYSQVSDSFNQMMTTLQESRTRQAQLVADAGHELKTPLTSMRTNIELLMMATSAGAGKGISAEDRADLERDVLAQMEEMSALITDLVDLAREEAPGTVSEEFRLDEVLHESLERAQRRRTDVQFSVRTQPWSMQGDRAAMGRALINVVDNAVKWSPVEGTVRITLRAGGKQAVLLVDDSGPGIPASEREKVFERFYRATETRSTPGSGLGLAITKQALARHEATVVVEDSDDGGARFRIALPGWPPGDYSSSTPTVNTQ